MLESNNVELPDRFQSLYGKRILVTGVAGFIGGNLFNRLSEYGLDVIGTVLCPEEALDLEKNGSQIKVLDLASSEPWDDLVQGVDIVFSIAAMFQEVGPSEEQFDNVNRRGAVKLVKTAARVGVERFVHCSTVGVYGNVKAIPATEDTPFNPMDEYHRTKLAGELEILKFAGAQPDDGMTVVVNRPAMVYGPGDLRMLKLFDTIISGRFHMIGSGKTLAHLGYIEDQTESFLLCAVAPRAEAHCEAFNIASGEPITLNELAHLIANAGGVQLSKLHIPVAPVWLAAMLCELVCRPLKISPPLYRRRVGFFTHNRAFDLSKARKHLGYSSNWSHQEGIVTTIKWYREKSLLGNR